MNGARHGKLNLMQKMLCIANGEEWNETLMDLYLGQYITSIEKKIKI